MISYPVQIVKEGRAFIARFPDVTFAHTFGETLVPADQHGGMGPAPVQVDHVRGHGVDRRVQSGAARPKPLDRRTRVTVVGVPRLVLGSGRQKRRFRVHPAGFGPTTAGPKLYGSALVLLADKVTA